VTLMPGRCYLPKWLVAAQAHLVVARLCSMTGRQAAQHTQAR
jgi:hypothetical protein